MDEDTLSAVCTLIDIRMYFYSERIEILVEGRILIEG